MDKREFFNKYKAIFIIGPILVFLLLLIFCFPRHSYLTGAEVFLTGNYVFLGLLPQEQTELGYELVVFRTDDPENFNKGVGSSELMLRWTGDRFTEASGFVENSQLVAASPNDLDFFFEHKGRIDDTSEALNRKKPSVYQNTGTRPGLPLRGSSWNSNLYLGGGNTKVRQLNLLYDDTKILITAYEINDNKSAEINLRYTFISDLKRARIGAIEYFYRPVVEGGIINLIKG